MASSSNLSVPKSFKYDVFLSFRGEDTRKNFVDHLYHAFKDKGIYTYKDDERIQRGKRISDDLFKSIQDSKFYIIVFSKINAFSSMVLKSFDPVFYDVEPTEVRNQSGAVGEAFAKHENEEAAGKWRETLKEAADMAGWELKNTLDGHQARFIKKVVLEISLELRSINSSFDENLVGMESRVKDIVSSLKIGIDEVHMIGIKGMGGAGKTTTARAVYDYLSNDDFEAKSFVENVREVSKASMFGLKKLQEQVLSKVLKEDVTLDSVNDGKNMMKKRMCGIKVLLVLDDVDHIDQLEALANGPNWFMPGSRIIITTRDEQVLVAHRVNLIRDIDLLSEQEAICLFSRYAFGTENPVQGYEELSGKVARYAAGLPLTIKVLGSFLCGKDKDDWEDAIERLEKIPLRETMEKLELSYTGLEDDYKEIFLDIACILKGKSKEDAITILESCGFHARNGLKVLEQRSLITISKGGFLLMHDHIEEMGKNIVRREHPDEPNKHSRLWITEEIKDILANDMGTEATRCLKKFFARRNLGILMKGIGKMNKLRYLEVYFRWDFDYGREESDDACLGSYLKLDESTQYFPNSVKYLKCSDYPFLYLPKTFQANNLVGLDMYHNRWEEKPSRMVQLWEEGEKKVLRKLKFLSLFTLKLTTFDFRITPNLERLSLHDSFKLKELCMPVSCQKLKHLVISESKLRTFDLGLIPNLETLSLENSRNLEELCMPVSCQKLKHLDISGSKLRTFDNGLTPNLEMLSLIDSCDLVELFMPVCCQKLKHLIISQSKLRTFDLGLTPNLEWLSLDNCAYFVELHVSAACPNLKFLNLCGSWSLRSLDLELIPNLKSLNLRESSLTSLDLEPIPNLERLDLQKCHELVKINAPVGCLRKVGYLNLRNCLRFTDFDFRGRSEPKVNCNSATLHLVGDSLDLCQLHPNSNLPKLQFDCSYTEYLSSSVGNIEKLISFGLCACTDLKKFSDIICSLQRLQKLTLKCNIPEFPNDLGQLECLEELYLSSTKIKLKTSSGSICLKKIEYLPDSICMLKHLKLLDVTECCRLEKLPEDIGQFVVLIMLNL
ncbi:disease resistance TIR-NBS-LRR class family protein [Tanacetum coccineum]|uniref:Disease resistance TIR-NBS-LRR class family protein n=1 Tax=Tanacetum coccineum TaxID=301880 RepID=A0ABQ5IB70_9ASTR